MLLPELNLLNKHLNELEWLTRRKVIDVHDSSIPSARDNFFFISFYFFPLL